MSRDMCARCPETSHSRARTGSNPQAINAPVAGFGPVPASAIKRCSVPSQSCLSCPATSAAPVTIRRASDVNRSNIT